MGHQLLTSPHAGLRRGAWTSKEDDLLKKCIEKYGARRWNLVPQRAGLSRCRKSCRLRWTNYLCPNIKRGRFDKDEEELIIRLQKLLGNRWSLIAGRLPGRTANDIKNHWNTHLCKKLHVPDQKEESANDAKFIKPQPQTIPVNWSWSKDQLACRSQEQREKSDMAKQLAPFENRVTEEDGSVDVDAANNGMPQSENKMTTELLSDYVLENNEELEYDELFMQGVGGWEDSLLGMNIWEDLGAL